MIRHPHDGRADRAPLPSPRLLLAVLFLYAVLVAFWITAAHAQTAETRNPVLVLFAPGPLVLAKRPPGAYSGEATYGASTQTRKVEVRNRLRTEYVRWRSDPETDFPEP